MAGVVITTIIITMTITERVVTSMKQPRTECVRIHTSKMDGNRAADSVRKTGSEICSPQV